MLILCCWFHFKFWKIIHLFHTFPISLLMRLLLKINNHHRRDIHIEAIVPNYTVVRIEALETAGTLSCWERIDKQINRWRICIENTWVLVECHVWTILEQFEANVISYITAHHLHGLRFTNHTFCLRMEYYKMNTFQ